MAKVIISFIVGTIALFISWLVLSEASPLENYFLWHSGVRNMWALLNIVPVIAAALIEGNPHSFSERVVAIGIFVQWFIVSYVLCAILFRRKKRPRMP